MCVALYRYRLTWLSRDQFDQFHHVRLIVFLNHTSLFELLFIGLAPMHVLWRLSGELIAPGADITLNDRPIVGRIYHTLLPGMIPISRKKDETWQYFLSRVGEDSLVAILPEGRMKRRNGLDKHGQPMTVRGGIADILSVKNSGKMMFVYSGGLHHVHAPGDAFPKLFKTIQASAELLDIAAYKSALTSECSNDFRRTVIHDIQKRLEEYS
ncbi:hypothetical protein NBRC116188_09350 [Oceaniserpentilla sp. 4NH20-0058]